VGALSQGAAQRLSGVVRTLFQSTGPPRCIRSVNAMKTLLCLSSIFCLVSISGNAIAKKKMPKSEVSLLVKGVTYKPGATIEVRVGEKIRVEAKVIGGRRSWCAEPETYANVGRNMVITANNENGLSFSINRGQFRGDWKLKEEKAKFKSGAGAKIKKVSNREADIEFPDEGVGQTYFNVTVKAKWNYVRRTPAGRREKSEEQTATDKFTFKIIKDKGVWFSSKNIVAKGTEDFRVRGRLSYIQRFFNEIEKHAKKRDFAKAKARLKRLKVEVNSLVEALKELKKKKPGSNCAVTIMGSPVGQVLTDIKKFEVMTKKWKTLAIIANGNAQKINTMLLKTQMTFSGNVLRSVFKNYINWGTSIPTGAEDLLTVYDPNNRLTPFDLPRKVMGWWETANKDASILKNQVQTIKILTELRKFYLKKMQDAVKEKKAFHVVLNGLQPAKKLATNWSGFIRGKKPVKWRPQP
jgi:hypothetical protein